MNRNRASGRRSLGRAPWCPRLFSNPDPHRRGKTKPRLLSWRVRARLIGTLNTFILYLRWNCRLPHRSLWFYRSCGTKCVLRASPRFHICLVSKGKDWPDLMSSSVWDLLTLANTADWSTQVCSGDWQKGKYKDHYSLSTKVHLYCAG